LLGQFARPTSSSRHTREAPPSVPEPRRERRQNVVLRELLEEMTYARERLEWLADEIWRQVTAENPTGP